MMMKSKVVRFGEISERFIPDLNLCVEERASLFFSPQEMRMFRRQAERDKTDSGRLSFARFNQRRNYVRYVLNVQSHNKSAGLDDPMGLAAIAVALSKGAMEQAHFRAAKDASKVEAAAAIRACPNELFTTETEADVKHPGMQTRKARVAINAPKRNRTVAKMA